MTSPRPEDDLVTICFTLPLLTELWARATAAEHDAFTAWLAAGAPDAEPQVAHLQRAWTQTPRAKRAAFLRWLARQCGARTP
jgi:hypothetical protein